MTAQEIFDHVTTFLRKQGEKSVIVNSEGGLHCYYRHPEKSLKCAIGCLIPDHLYEEKMDAENYIVDSLFMDYPSLNALYGKHVELLHKLQHIHDTEPISDWEKEWQLLANEEKLAY